MESVTVIIPARNEADNLPRVLEVLSREQVDEIVVVDDGSTDSTAEAAESFGARVIRNEKALGPGACRNLAVEQTTSRFIAFFDADTRPAPGIIEKLLEPFRNNSSVSSSVGVYADEPIIDKPFQRYRARLSTVYHKLMSGDEVDIFLTAMGIVRREAFVESGGFDLSYEGADIEDLEFGDRLIRIGPIILVRDAEVGHVFPEYFDNLRLYFRRAGMFVFRARQKGGFDKYQVTPRLGMTRMAGAAAFLSLPFLPVPLLRYVTLLSWLVYIFVGWPVLTGLLSGATPIEAIRRIWYDLTLSAASSLGAIFAMLRISLGRTA